MEERQEFALTFERITEADVPELTEVMIRAFDDDARRNQGQERGGPPGYDDGSFLRQWALTYKESHGYKVSAGERIIGSFIVWILPGGDYRLGMICVDPSYGRRGIGTRMWEFIEATYPEAKSWTLDTPEFASSNHRFYEKRGFRQVGSREDEGMQLRVYRKDMQPAEQG